MIGAIAFLLIMGLIFLLYLGDPEPEPLCCHEWSAPVDRERLGGEWYDLVVCEKCGKEHWR